MNRTNLTIGIKVILAILFMGCLLDMPYGYFQLVRFTGMSGFVLLAYFDSTRKDKTLMIMWILFALLINPFIKVALGRTIWNVVDVIWAVTLIITIFLKQGNPNEKTK